MTNKKKTALHKTALLEKINIGLVQSKNGNVVPKEKAKKMLMNWFNS